MNLSALLTASSGIFNARDIALRKPSVEGSPTGKPSGKMRPAKPIGATQFSNEILAHIATVKIGSLNGEHHDR